jgi:hypothetical protein
MNEREDPSPSRQRGEIKSVGKSGQISLGKRYAGKMFSVRHQPDGSLLLTAVAMVPESQLWTLREPDRGAIVRGMTWAASAPASETDLDELSARASRLPGSKHSGQSRRSRPSRAGAK